MSKTDEVFVTKHEREAQQKRLDASWSRQQTQQNSTPQSAPGLLPLDSKERKEVPLWTFIRTYFPKTFIAMARLSFKANEKHNPGQPMHWAREKSSDHKDCAMRHWFDEERIDPETGEPEAVAAAWRACANAEQVLDRLDARKAMNKLIVSGDNVHFYEVQADGTYVPQ